MKIAIIGSRGYPYVYSGYETFVSEVAPRLVAKGVEVHVYCHKKLFKERPKEVNGIRLHYFSSIKSKSLSQWSNTFLCTMHAVFSKYDVILYVNSANGIFGPLTRIFRKRTAINVDGLEWLRPKWKGLGAKVFYLSSKMATRWMDRIITDADAMKDVYIEEFKTESVVIAYGANIRYSRQPELISQWQLEKDGYYLIVGRLIPDNNALLILEEFIRSDSGKKLVIVGDVPYQDEYATRIKAIKDARVIFTGYVNGSDQLAELYHNCFAYFHGHEFGGTNPTLLKALAYGCAVIALDTKFSREVLKSEEHGVYFSKDKDDLCQLIREIEKKPEKLATLKGKSRLRITENYTWEKITGQYFDLFQEMYTSQK
ncbi:glycosyltransferase [Terrimonas sp. NA20]|uniref:Glycosyltransferase n=1 Tax=Terrimonas ginsenosidimutans TaxID=2908004 RepID=A0ABS9KUS1_9BACT|nr:glycosyltransferase [Terrimonas ginsenosidimutans]MCG2616081.1 glycosyltransferase [Terrimonas ginsenosidimutans]